MKHQSFHETKTHGMLTFPYTVYNGNIPGYLASFPLHWHDEMELIYVTGGCGIVTVSSQQYIANAGDIVVVLPQVVHSIEQYENRQMEYFNILFRFSLLNASTNDICYEKYFKPLYDHTKCVPVYLASNTPLNSQIHPYISYLTETREGRDVEDELMVKSSLFAIISKLNRYSCTASTSELTLQNTYDKLKKVLLYVRENYSMEIPVSTAADICGFSPSYFMKLFKELTGKSFSQYLIHYRLEVAARLLSKNEQKITEVATDTGFNNLSYFTRAFVSKYGITPSAGQSYYQRIYHCCCSSHGMVLLLRSPIHIMSVLKERRFLLEILLPAQLQYCTPRAASPDTMSPR
ncbi:MAG: AraC family transcriptional regulator [Clostridiales bacterium]|nr:AraC family transcriptional regulator [Clostridiales bacterium]